MNKILVLITITLLTAPPVLARDITKGVIVGPEGANLTVTDGNSPLRGFSVVVPPGALETRTTIKLFAGPKHILRAGVPSDITVHLQADGVESFNEPVTIRCRFTPNKWNGYTAVGYAIDSQNHLDVLDKVGENTVEGYVDFMVFLPVNITWAWVDASR